VLDVAEEGMLLRFTPGRLVESFDFVAEVRSFVVAREAVLLAAVVLRNVERFVGTCLQT
jgi:hypothetical protein